MNDKVKEKITKVYELVKRGIAGEQQSAEKMLNKLLEKYNISEDELNSIAEKEYYFKYSSDLDQWLLTTSLRIKATKFTALKVVG